MLLVDIDGDALAIVPDGDQVFFLIDLDINLRHILIPLEIVCSVDKNLICKEENDKPGSNDI